MKKGLIGDIGRSAVHDGPGIRTTIFFKGCPLQCPWCHNPEFIDYKQEIALYPEQCMGCGDCLAACPNRALDIQENVVQLDRSRCDGCGQCAEQCPTLSLKQIGQWYTVDSLTEVILRDQLFYETSGGGVTLSGGEPTRQLDFVGNLLHRLKKHNVHTAIQTCGYFDRDAFAEQALDLLDLIYFDIKLFDPEVHRKYLGNDNALIIENLSYLLQEKPDDVIVRIPLIPGYTATRENITPLAELLQKLGAKHIALLPYHSWGISKVDTIGGKMDAYLPTTPMSSEELSEWRQYFRQTEMVAN